MFFYWHSHIPHVWTITAKNHLTKVQQSIISRNFLVQCALTSATLKSRHTTGLKNTLLAFLCLVFSNLEWKKYFCVVLGSGQECT